MKKRAGQASIEVPRPPDAVFATIAARAPGEDWDEPRRLLGRPFVVRSHVIELDHADRRLVYRSKLAGEDPSFTIWSWAVEPAGQGGARVTLGWDLRPVTFVRKRLISPLRDQWIARRQAPAMLAAIGRAPLG